MKMIRMMVGLSLMAGIASATPILDETFDTSVGLVIDNNAQFTNEVAWGQWVGTADAVENVGSLKVVGTDGKTRGVFISLNESEFADEVADYRLTLHWSMTLSADSYLKTQIFEADIGSGGVGNYYLIDSYAGSGTGPSMSTTGDAFKNQITNTVSVAGIVNNQEQVIEFSTDGTHDVAMVFAHMSTSATKGVLYLEDVRLEVIPEPATLGLVVATGTGILFIRRRLMM